MKMPASFAEFSDALQKARIKDGSFCKNELTCIHYNGLTHAMIGWNANLYDLNLFAQRLASLTEEQKKGMDALLKIKQNHRVAPIPLNQLINLTYNTDICCFAPRVSNHEELGAFLYANEMLSNEAMALLDTTEEGSGFQERLLELLGEQHQEDHGGVFTDFGYAELGGEIKDIYVCQSNETACFHRSDAPVMLEVRKGFFNDPSYDNDKTAVLNLPAADAGIWRAVEKVDAASVDECAFRCVDCLIPFLRDAINNAKQGLSKQGKLEKGYIKSKYGNSSQIRFLKGHPLIPAGYIRHKNPLGKKRSINRYTESGREEIHRMLGVNIEILTWLMRNPRLGQSVEYADNRISLYAAQYGKCAVTGRTLALHEIHCHHKRPKSAGGTDA